jgi:hypothetical protein
LKCWCLADAGLSPTRATRSTPVEIGGALWNAIQKGEALPSPEKRHDTFLDSEIEKSLMNKLGATINIPKDFLIYESSISIADVNQNNKYAKVQLESTSTIKVHNIHDFYDLIDKALGW